MRGPAAAGLFAACACAAALYLLGLGGSAPLLARRSAPPGAVLACGVRVQDGPHGSHLVTSRAHAARSTLASVHASQLWCEHHFAAVADGGSPQPAFSLPSPAYAHPVLGSVALRVAQPVLEQVARDAGRDRVCSRSPRRVAVATALLGTSRACGCPAGAHGADRKSHPKTAACRQFCRLQRPATHLLTADPVPLLASPPPPHTSFRAAVADSAHLSWSCALHEAASLARRVACAALDESGRSAADAANATAALCRGTATLAPLLDPSSAYDTLLLPAAASGALAWEWIAWHRVAESRAFGIARQSGEDAGHWSCLVPLADSANHGVESVSDGSGESRGRQLGPAARHADSAPCLPWPNRSEGIPAPWAVATAQQRAKSDDVVAPSGAGRPNAAWRMDGDAFTLHTTAALAPGGEVLLHYGHRSLRAWILAYAFVPRVGRAMAHSARDEVWASAPRLHCSPGPALAPLRLHARPPRGDSSCGAGGHGLLRLPLRRWPTRADAAAVAAELRSCLSSLLRRQMRASARQRQSGAGAEGDAALWLRALPRGVRRVAVAPCAALRTAFAPLTPLEAAPLPRQSSSVRRGADDRAVSACVAGEAAFVNASRADAACLAGHLAETALLTAAFTQWGQRLAHAGPAHWREPRSPVETAEAVRGTAIGQWAAWSAHAGRLLSRHHSAGQGAAAALGLCAGSTAAAVAVAAGEASRRVLQCVAHVALQCIDTTASAMAG